MRKYVSTPRFIDVETHHLPADGTLCNERMKPPLSEELEELDDPYGKEPHIRRLAG